MSAIVDFLIRFNEQGLGAVGSNTNRVMASMNRTLNTTQGHFSMVGRSIADLNTRMELLKQKRELSIDTSQIVAANREIQQLENRMKDLSRMGTSASAGVGGGGSSKYGRAAFVGNLAARGVEMAAREAAEVGRDALGNGIDLERMKIGLSTFVHDQASPIIEGIMQQAIRTPFTSQQLLPIESGLISTGMAPERANRDMMSLANAVAGSGGSDFMLELMGSHMSQAASAGKMDGMLVREFQRTAHIPLNRLLGDDMFPKLSVAARTKKAGELDEISYDQFSHALYRASKAGGLYAGAMERLSQTMSGKNSTIKDAWWNMTAKLTESQMGPMKRWQDMMIHAIEDVPKIVEQARPYLERIFSAFDNMLPALLDFGKSAGEALKPLFGFITSEEVSGLGKSMLNLATVITRDLTPVITAAATIAKPITSTASGLLDIIATDFDFSGAAANADDYFGNLPDWAKGKDGVSMSGSDHSKLFHLVKEQYGGVQPWMNTDKEMESYLNSGYFTQKPALPTGYNNMFHLDLMKGFVRNDQLNPKDNVDKDGMNSALGAAVGDTGTKISDGGNRQLIINLNAPMIKDQVFHVSSMKEAKEYSLREQQEIFLTVAQSLKKGL